MGYTGVDYWKNFSTFTPGYVPPAGGSAAQQIANATGQPTTCTVYGIGFPGIDPATGAAGYNTDQCGLPSQYNGVTLDANTLENSGGAYDLAAELRSIQAGHIIGSDSSRGATVISSTSASPVAVTIPAGPSDGTVAGAKPSDPIAIVMAADNQTSTPGGTVKVASANITANTITEAELLDWMQSNAGKNFATVDEWNFAFNALAGSGAPSWEVLVAYAPGIADLRATAVSVHRYLTLVQGWQAAGAAQVNNGAGGLPTGTPGGSAAGGSAGGTAAGGSAGGTAAGGDSNTLMLALAVGIVLFFILE